MLEQAHKPPFIAAQQFHLAPEWSRTGRERNSKKKEEEKNTTRKVRHVNHSWTSQYRHRRPQYFPVGGYISTDLWGSQEFIRRPRFWFSMPTLQSANLHKFITN